MGTGVRVENAQAHFAALSELLDHPGGDHQLFEVSQFSEPLSAFAADLTRLAPMNGLGVGAGLPAFGSFRPCRAPSVRPTDALAVHGRFAALRTAMLGARLAARHLGAVEDGQGRGEIRHERIVSSRVTECTVALARAAC